MCRGKVETFPFFMLSIVISLLFRGYNEKKLSLADDEETIIKRTVSTFF